VAMTPPSVSVHKRPLRFCAPLISALLIGANALAEAQAAEGSSERVGPAGTNRLITPVNQVLTPYGVQVDLPGLRPQAIAVSPKGKLLAVSGKTSQLLILDPATGEILQKVPLPSEKLNEPQPPVASANILEPDKKGQVSFTGLIFSPDGKRIYLSNVNGSIKVFNVGLDGTVAGWFSIGLPGANLPWRKEEIPAGLALSPDGKRLYV